MDISQARINTPEAPDWDALAQSIADGEAILVLGPDAIPLYQTGGENGQGDQEMTFSKLSRIRILDQLKEEINHFYERDNLFQFSSANAKRKAMKCVREASRDKNWSADRELLRQIVAIPFPLILTINPDKSLFEAFLGLWREPQFDFFSTKGKETAELAYPYGHENPILFQLCGSVSDKLDSVILDYYDLFELLKNLLADNGIPEAIGRKLQEADRFVLLGFDLERWYAQLFLHYLNKLDNHPFNNSNQNFPILSQVDKSTQEFVMRQFNIKYFGTSRDDFDHLYQACERLSILRKVQDPRSPLVVQIRGLISKGKLEEAIKLTEAQLDDPEGKQALVLLQARYSDCLIKQKEGISDERDLRIEINQIRYSLLTLYPTMV